MQKTHSEEEQNEHAPNRGLAKGAEQAVLTKFLATRCVNCLGVMMGMKGSKDVEAKLSTAVKTNTRRCKH